MKKNSDYPSLAKDYFYYALVIFSLLLSVFLFNSYLNYQRVIKDRKEFYESDAQRAKEGLDIFFQSINDTLREAAIKISASNPKELKLIEAIINDKHLKPKFEESIFSWSVIMFLDTEGNIVVDNMNGILNTPMKTDRERKEWFDKLQSQPWRMRVSDPDVILNTGEYGVSVGYGIINHNNEFIGAVAIDINLYRIAKRIKNLISSGTSFLLIDKDYNIIASNDITIEDNKIKNIPSLNNIKNVTASFFPDPFDYRQSSYYYYTKVKSLPYYIIIGESHKNINEYLNSSIMATTETIILLTFAFLILLYFFKSKILLPVLELSKFADQIAKGKLEDVQVPITNSLEINKLSRELQNVLNYTKELQQTKNDLFFAKQSLQAALKAVEEAKKAKNILVASLAYGLKVPAHKVINHAEYLIKNITLSDPGNPLIAGWQEVANTTKFIQALVLDLLDYVKSEGEQIVLHKEDIDIKEQILYVIDILKVISDQMLIEVEAEFPKTLPALYADPLRIKQILTNIISNAIISSSASSLIKIEASYGQDLKITIKDQRYKKLTSGVEISNPFITSKYEENKDDIKKFGTMISSKLIELHGGSLNSIKDEEGEIFILSFPIGE